MNPDRANRRDLMKRLLGVGVAGAFAGHPVPAAELTEGATDSKQRMLRGKEEWDERSFPTVVEPEPLKVGTRPQLFVDDYAVEDSSLMVRTLHPVTKFPGNPVLTAEYPWEKRLEDGGLPGIMLYGTVLFDPERQLYRMWYLTRPLSYKYHVCYAESADGIVWKKPLMDLVPFQSYRKTNLVLAPGVTYRGRVVVGENGAQPLTVMRDEHDAPQRRFKGMFTTSKTPRGMMTCYSRDGLHWEFPERNPVLPGWSDTSNTLFWDPLNKKYTLMMRPVLYTGVKRRSAVSVSQDFVHWSFPRIVMRCDERDNPDVNFPEFTLKHLDFPRQVYGLPAFYYEGLYLGLKQVMDRRLIRVELAYSRDLLHWFSDPLRREFVPLGPPGSWDSTMNQAVPPVQTANGMRFYYGGKDWEHTAEAAKSGHSSVGFGTLRKHGFYSLDSGDHIGQLLTRPLLCEGTTLSLNAVVRGSLQVAVEDAFGQTVTGFSLVDCEPIVGDVLEHRVRWTKAEFSQLRGIPIRLRIQVDRGEIYSFQIS